MNDLVVSNPFGVIERKGIAVVGSRKVAEIFEKRHDNVLRDIEVTIDGLNNLKNSENNDLNFEDVEFQY